MALKRKSIDETPRSSKRQHTAGDNDDDFILSDHESISASNNDDDDDSRSNIATPYSPASSRTTTDSKNHTCPYPDCNKSFDRPARLTEHLRSHTNDRIFKCDQPGCTKDFLRQSHLTHHIKSAHSSVREYACDREGCDKKFVTATRLRRHLAAHEGRDKYRCTEHPPCDETFRKHSTLQKHIVSVHLNQKPFPCTKIDPTTRKQCTLAFDTAGHLRAHETRVHGGARFTCTECSSSLDANDTDALNAVTFPTYALLQSHIKQIHPPSCPHCTVICSTSRELRRHFELAHGNLSVDERRVHTCPTPGCNRGFTKKGNLNVHIRTVHEGEKKFICGITDLSSSKKVEGWGTGEDLGCGRPFGSKMALEEHIRTSHFGLQNSKAEKRASRRGSTASSIATISQQQKRKPDPYSLAALTGVGYAEETGRQIPCLAPGCEYRFYRDHDLFVHVEAFHGVRIEEEDLAMGLDIDFGDLDMAGAGADNAVMGGMEMQMGAEMDLGMELPSTDDMDIGMDIGGEDQQMIDPVLQYLQS